MPSRIKAVRESLGLSQKEFGEKLGVSRDVICNLEYGRVMPKLRFLKHISELYGVSEVWLETGEGKMFSTDPVSTRKSKEVQELFCALKPEFQDFALEQIRKLLELQDK